MAKVPKVKKAGGKIESVKPNRFDSADGQVQASSTRRRGNLQNLFAAARGGADISKVAQVNAIRARQKQIEEANKARKREELLGRMKQDLDLQIRSEFGFDGTETYFEAYFNQVQFVLANMFANFQTYNYFLLGSTVGAGILGSSALGSVLNTSTRQLEVNAIQDFTEDFTGSTYKDALTTGEWSNTGSLTFIAGSVAVISNWKSGSFELTTFDRVTATADYNVFGSGLKFEASLDGGSTYTQIFQSIESSVSPTGSDFRLRITDPTQTSVISKFLIVTKGDNYPAG